MLEVSKSTFINETKEFSRVGTICSQNYGAQREQGHNKKNKNEDSGLTCEIEECAGCVNNDSLLKL